MQPVKTTPPHRARTSSRRRLIISASAAAAVAVVIGADASFGALAQERASCRVVEGVTVEADLKALPVTAGLVSGSVGTATAHVPWDVMAERAAVGSPQGAPLSLQGDGSRVIAETSVRALPVSVTLLPEVTRSGELALTPIGLTVSGREVPLVLARSFGGADELLQSRVLSGADGLGLAYEVTSVTVSADGLDLSMRLPMAALTSSGRGQDCPAGAPHAPG